MAQNQEKVTTHCLLRDLTSLIVPFRGMAWGDPQGVRAAEIDELISVTYDVKDFLKSNI